MSPEKRIRRIIPTEPSDESLPPPRERPPRRIYTPDQAPDDLAAAAQPATPDTDPASTQPENHGAVDVEELKRWFEERPEAWRATFDVLGLNVSHLLDLYYGKTQLEDYQSDGPPTLTHAGTGEPVPLQDAKDQIDDPRSPGLRDKLNVEIGEAVRKLTN